MATAITANEANLMGQDDSLVLEFARNDNRILLTRNCKDFRALHLNNSNHPGIFGIHHNRDYSKDMSILDIVKAIANLEAAQIPLVNQFIVLNHWNY